MPFVLVVDIVVVVVYRTLRRRPFSFLFHQSNSPHPYSRSVVPGGSSCLCACVCVCVKRELSWFDWPAGVESWRCVQAKGFFPFFFYQHEKSIEPAELIEPAKWKKRRASLSLSLGRSTTNSTAHGLRNRRPSLASAAGAGFFFGTGKETFTYNLDSLLFFFPLFFISPPLPPLHIRLQKSRSLASSKESKASHDEWNTNKCRKRTNSNTDTYNLVNWK